MKDRLQLLLQDNNMSASKLAELIDVQPSGISHILSGRNNPSMEFIVKCLNAFPNINPEWFIMGTGPMYKSAQNDFSATGSDPISNHDHETAHDLNTIAKDTLNLPNNASNINNQAADLFEDNYMSSTTSDLELQQAKHHHKLNKNNYQNSDSARHKISNQQKFLPLDCSEKNHNYNTNKKITKVMIFYSDHTVESFDYSDN